MTFYWASSLFSPDFSGFSSEAGVSDVFFFGFAGAAAFFGAAGSFFFSDSACGSVLMEL